MHTKKNKRTKRLRYWVQNYKEQLKREKKYINVFALKVKKNLLLMLAIYVYLKKKKKKRFEANAINISTYDIYNICVFTK